MVSSRRSRKSKLKNVLSFAPQGFSKPIHVEFPERRLPVCGRCKKNFKTREFCRARDGHTELPWSMTYVCITLDQSCTDEDGKLLEGPFISRTLPPQPYAIKGETVDPDTPICAPCKEKNYTRSYCRKKQSHRHLPWSTVYTMLSLAKPGEFTPSHEEIKPKVKQEAVSPNIDKVKQESDVKHETPGSNEENPAKKRKVEGEGEEKETPVPDKKIESDNFSEIPISRTFVCKVSTEVNTIHWLDIDTNLISISEWNDIQAQAFRGNQNIPDNSFHGINSYPGAGPPGSAYRGGGMYSPSFMMGMQGIGGRSPSALVGMPGGHIPQPDVPFGSWNGGPGGGPMSPQWINHQNAAAMNMGWQFGPPMGGRMDAATAAAMMREEAASGMMGAHGSFPMGMFQPPPPSFSDVPADPSTRY